MNADRHIHYRRNKPGSLLDWLRAGPAILKQAWSSRRLNKELFRRMTPMRISEEAVSRLRPQWEQLLAAPSRDKISLGPEEQEVISRIHYLTTSANRNNITRTAAYWELYQACPEVHWAFLAHMVSRNGGYSMTDLQGDLLPQLLGREDRTNIFLFLERINSLIFQDAYPQLLLYQESKRAGRPLFHLLPCFHISAFMHPVWQQFWMDLNSAMLTICLIINEQNYIEGRVVQAPHYRKRVLERPFFLAMPYMQLNQVVLPYDTAAGFTHRGRSWNGEKKDPRVKGLAGLVVEHFVSLNERIGAGKALYGMLFGVPDILRGAELFAAGQRHTGSRADYDPLLYQSGPKAVASPSASCFKRLYGDGKTKGETARLYSPVLSEAWKDCAAEPAGIYDWFRQLKDADGLGDALPPKALDMTGEVWLGLYKQELAVLAARASGWQPEQPV